MKIIPETKTTIIPERDFNFRSFRKMYLRLLPDDRAQIQFVLSMLVHNMGYKLAKSKDKRKMRKTVS